MQWCWPANHHDSPSSLNDRRPKMKMLLLLLTALLSRGMCLLPPLNLTISSFNFKHKLHWIAAPDSPPGVTYHVFARHSNSWKQVATSESPWAEVKLRHLDSYTLFVKSCLKKTCSLQSKILRFTPYLDTVITSPNVTMSGCGKCIWMNISLPKAPTESGLLDLSKIYPKISYNVSWRRKTKVEVAFMLTKNQTVIIPHLLPHTEYCVLVRPFYDEVIFHPSPWRCVFTSVLQPSPVFAVVGLVAALVVLCLLALILILFGLQYTGLMCKLKEALPHPLLTNLWGPSLLRLERTVPEPVSLLPGTEDSHWDQDEEDQETIQADQGEDQEEDQYMNRCPDLSSDSSCGFGNVSSSCKSTAAAITLPESQDEETVEVKDDQIVNNENWRIKESQDDKEEEWRNELEKYESVNLFSVTITTMELQPDQEQCEQSLLYTKPLTHQQPPEGSRRQETVTRQPSTGYI